MDKPVIAVTMGDPAGIGPELCLRLLSDRELGAECRPVVYGGMDVLGRVARTCGLPVPAQACSLADWEEGIEPSGSLVVDLGAINADGIRPGQVQEACGRAAAAYIEAAVRDATSGRVAAIATAPIHKAALNLAGIAAPGHTELLARLTGSERFCMMMASEELCISLVTTHTGYADVPAMLTQARIRDVVDLTVSAMSTLGKADPRIVVCALNPHGGEGGLFGQDEECLIAEAVESARGQGVRAEGPIPPDTAFLPERRRTTDAYVAMYHDQGLIPFKMLAFDRGVNVTLGLPIVRTSPDHGTAFDIAWQGKAFATSMVASVRWAVRLAARGAES